MENVIAELMACVAPTQGDEVEYAVVAAKLQKVRWNKLVSAMSPVQQEEFEGIVTHMDNLAKGCGPQDISSHSTLTKQVCEKALSVYQVKVTDKKKLPASFDGKKKAKGPWVLCGQLAPRAQYKTVEERFFANDVNLSLGDFKWV